MNRTAPLKRTPKKCKDCGAGIWKEGDQLCVQTHRADCPTLRAMFEREQKLAARKALKRAQEALKGNGSLKLKNQSTGILRSNSPISARRKTSKKHTRRKKLASRKALIRQLDSLTSQIVRLRDGACVQCSTTEKLTCGHVLSRRSHATRWDLTNCHAQCWPQNFAHGSHSPVPYFQWFIRKFGQEVFDALYTRWAKGRKFSTSELREMVSEYEKKLSQMQLSA